MARTRKAKGLRNPNPNRLEELRRARGLTQDQVATLTGYSLSAVNRHESGNRGLDGTAIDRYAKLFNVTPFELFVNPGQVGPDGVDSPSPDTVTV